MQLTRLPPACQYNTIHGLVSSNAFLAATLIMAGVLRVAHIVSLMRLPIFEVLILDSWMYDEWAKRIASGEWLGGARPFYMDPLYPYFLAVLYRLFGRDLLIVRLLQAAMGVGTCALVAILGRRVASKAVGNVAALMMAVCRPEIFQEGEIEKTALGVFLVTASLVLALGRSLRSKFAAGLVVGLSALTRSNLLIFGPLGAIYCLVEPLAAYAPIGGQDRIIGRRALGTVLFLGGFLAILAPVTWRNYHVSGDRVITTSSAGANFYTGNNPKNRSGGFEPVPFVRPNPAFEEEDFRTVAEQRMSRHLLPSEISRYWFGQALLHFRNQPGFALTVMMRKLLLFWSDFELPDGWDMYLLARYSFVLLLFPIGMGLILPLAVVGAAIGFPKIPGVRLFVGYIVIYSASVIGFFIFSRYRVYVFPALVVLASVGLRWAVAVIRSRDFPLAIVALLSMAVVSALSFFGLKLTNVKMADPAQGFMNLAAVYYEKGDARSAEHLLGDALAKFPNSPAALCGMGRLQLANGRRWISADLLARCVKQDPAYPQAWFSLGEAYRMDGNLSDAANAYRKQIEMVPGHSEAARALLNIEDELFRRSP